MCLENETDRIRQEEVHKLDEKNYKQDENSSPSAAMKGEQIIPSPPQQISWILDLDTCLL